MARLRGWVGKLGGWMAKLGGWVVRLRGGGWGRVARLKGCACVAKLVEWLDY